MALPALPVVIKLKKIFRGICRGSYPESFFRSIPGVPKSIIKFINADRDMAGEIVMGFYIHCNIIHTVVCDSVSICSRL